MTRLADYRIMLGNDPWQVVLISDSNPKAQRPFDGGRIHYDPPSYPASVCSFRFAEPTCAPDAKQYEPPRYSGEIIDYRERTVRNEGEWWALKADYKARRF